MKKDLPFLYDKHKTIKENAFDIGVNEKTIRNFMTKNEISGVENNFNQRISLLFQTQKQLVKQGIKPTIKNLSNELQWSKNTIAKYKKIIEKNSKEGNNSLPYFGIKRNQIIKNYSFNQSEILQNIILLHLKEEKRFFLDCTYSFGNFYEQSKHFYVPQPVIKMDVNPQFSDVLKIDPCGRLPFADNSISSIVIDLPFLISPKDPPALKWNNEKYSIMQKRFFSLYPKEELFRTYFFYINEAYRILCDNGILVMKVQGVVTGGVQIFTPEYCFMVAQQCNFYCLDQFFLILKNRIHSPKISEQHHARKYTSTFYVFIKTKKKKVDYFKWNK